MDSNEKKTQLENGKTAEEEIEEVPEFINEDQEESEKKLISSVVEDFKELQNIQKSSPEQPVELLAQHKPAEKIERKAQRYLEKQKDYSAYESVRHDYPLFLQLPNACGLSSILMLLDPIRNEKIGTLLNKIWDIFEQNTVIEQRRLEFRWAYALEYLLLKSASFNAISEYIKKFKSEELDHYYIGLESVLRYQQEGHQDAKNDLIVDAYEAYFTRGYITPWIVSHHIDLFKHNPEIQILMALFGYEFVRQPSPDGTGALFFTEDELKNLESHTAKKKIKILRSEFIKGARIMMGLSFHWVALTNIFVSKGHISISINDPAGKRYSIPLKSLTEKDRFYIYRKMKQKQKRIWTDIEKVLEEDGQKEIELTMSILEELKERHKKSMESSSKVKIKRSLDEEEYPMKEELTPIPVKVHEDTMKVIKREKKPAKVQKPKQDKDEGAKETSTKEAFDKKMREIIGDDLDTNNDE